MNKTLFLVNSLAWFPPYPADDTSFYKYSKLVAKELPMQFL